MLELLGVPFIQAASEAEAMCAFLNRHHVGRNSSTLFQFVALWVRVWTLVLLPRIPTIVIRKADICISLFWGIWLVLQPCQVMGLSAMILMQARWKFCMGVVRSMVYYRLVNAASQESGLSANNKLCIGKKSITSSVFKKMFCTKPIRLWNTVFSYSERSIATWNVQREVVDRKLK